MRILCREHAAEMCARTRRLMRARLCGNDVWAADYRIRARASVTHILGQGTEPFFGRIFSFYNGPLQLFENPGNLGGRQAHHKLNYVYR